MVHIFKIWLLVLYGNFGTEAGREFGSSEPLDNLIIIVHWSPGSQHEPNSFWREKASFLPTSFLEPCPCFALGGSCGKYAM